MSDNNKLVISEEINLYILIKNIWNRKFHYFGIILIFALSSIIYSLVVSEKFEVRCVIKANDANEELLINPVSSFGKLSLTGQQLDPVSSNIMLTLESTNFLSIFAKKYKDEERLFDDLAESIRENILDDKLAEEHIFESSIKALKKIIFFSHDPSKEVIYVTVKLEDKYFAYKLLNEVLVELKKYIKKHNAIRLNEDLEYYKNVLSSIKDPSIVNKLRQKFRGK